MNKQEQVYEAIACKELSFGCKIKSPVDGRVVLCGDSDGYITDGDGVSFTTNQSYYQKIPNKDIIGHPIHYGYAVDWLFRKFPDNKIYKYKLFEKWKDLLQPIEHPENKEALDFIFNLIEKGKK